MLGQVGTRHLRHEEIRDQAGQLRVLLRRPNREDFAHRTCREIRHHGVENFHVARRLRVMIDNLLQTLPDYRQPALREELALLDATLMTLHFLPQDLALARVPDTQGLGGAAAS